MEVKEENPHTDKIVFKKRKLLNPETLNGKSSENGNFTYVIVFYEISEFNMI